MNVIRGVIRMVVLIAVLAAGLALMSASVSPGFWQAWLTVSSGARETGFWLGAALVLCGVLFAAGDYRRGRRDRYLTFQNEGGMVSISTAAMADFLSRLAVEFPSVVRMVPRVIPRRRSIDIVVDVRVRAGSQVHEMCELLQKRVRESVVNSLGISEVRRVVVTVRGIVSEHRPV